jgi:hypothetical protein
VRFFPFHILLERWEVQTRKALSDNEKAIDGAQERVYEDATEEAVLYYASAGEGTTHGG